MQHIVVDAGPLIALFDRDETRHTVVRRWFERHVSASKLITTEAVVTEVTHLLDFSVPVQTRFVRWAGQCLRVEPIEPETYALLADWMDTYANVPMDFADATLLWTLGRLPDAKLMTFDERGFGVFRAPPRGGQFPQMVRLK